MLLSCSPMGSQAAVRPLVRPAALYPKVIPHTIKPLVPSSTSLLAASSKYRTLFGIRVGLCGVSPSHLCPLPVPPLARYVCDESRDRAILASAFSWMVVVMSLRKYACWGHGTPRITHYTTSCVHSRIWQPCSLGQVLCQQAFSLCWVLRREMAPYQVRSLAVTAGVPDFRVIPCLKLAVESQDTKTFKVEPSQQCQRDS